jgi:hypothetical protein
MANLNSRTVMPENGSAGAHGAGTRELVFASVVALILLGVWLPFARVGLDRHHDGIMLKPALDVLAGQVLFRDTFSQYGALTTYLHVLGLWIQPTLLTLRVMSVVAMVLAGLIFYAAWREILPVSLAAAASGLYAVCVYFMLPGWLVLPWSSDFAMLFQAVTFFALLKILRSGEWTWAVVTGMSCAAVFWCRQPVGGLLAGALLVVLVMAGWMGWQAPSGKTRRVFGAVAAGYVGVTAIMFAGLMRTEALGAWWEQNVLWPKRWALAMGQTSDVFLPSWNGAELTTALCIALSLAFLVLPIVWRRFGGSQWPRWEQIIYYVGLLMWAGVANEGWPFWMKEAQLGWMVLGVVVVLGIALGYGVAAVRLHWLGRVPSREFFQVAALAGVSVVSLAQIYPVACARHQFWAVGPVYGLVVYALWRLAGVRAGVMAASIGLLLVPMARERYSWGGYVLRQPAVEITQVPLLVGMRVEAEQEAFCNELDKEMERWGQVRPGVGAVLFGEDALNVALARTLDNPSPFYVTWQLLRSPEEVGRRWRWIVEQRPLILVEHGRGGDTERFQKEQRYVELKRSHAKGLEIYVPEEWAEQMRSGRGVETDKTY